MKQLVRNILKFCEENEQYNVFIKLFFRKGILRAAVKTAQLARKEEKKF